MKIGLYAYSHKHFTRDIADGLAAKGHKVFLLPGIPMDVANFDAILYYWLDQNFSKISHMVQQVPVVGIIGGTDAFTAQDEINGNTVYSIIGCNEYHLVNYKNRFPYLRTRLIHWGVNPDKWTYKERVLPEIKNNKITGLRAVAVGIQTSNKGLPSLINMLTDCPNIDHSTLQLNVVGNFVDHYTEQWVNMMKDRVPYQIKLHGFQVHLDKVLDQIDPHIHIHTSLMEQDCVSMMETSLKGIPIFAQPWPSFEKIWNGSPVVPFNGGRDLGEKLMRFAIKPSPSKEFREFAEKKFNYQAFIDGVERELQDAVLIRKSQLERKDGEVISFPK